MDTLDGCGRYKEEEDNVLTIAGERISREKFKLLRVLGSSNDLRLMDNADTNNLEATWTWCSWSGPKDGSRGSTNDPITNN